MPRRVTTHGHHMVRICSRAAMRSCRNDPDKRVIDVGGIIQVMSDLHKIWSPVHSPT